MDKKNTLEIINNKLEISNKNQNSEKEHFKILSEYLNEIVLYDFNKLLNILYRIDVSERKVISALAKNKTKNAGEVIALLLIEREAEKQKYREWYKKQENKNDDFI